MGCICTRIRTRCFLCAHSTLGVSSLASSGIFECLADQLSTEMGVECSEGQTGDLYRTVWFLLGVIKNKATPRPGTSMSRSPLMWVGLIRASKLEESIQTTMEGSDSVFQFKQGQKFVVTPEIQQSFDRNGYILVR